MGFEFSQFSKKQLEALTFWTKEDSPSLIIASGAIRSGKTSSLSLSFAIWAMTKFNDQNFGVCGKTVGSCRRNVVEPLKKMLSGLYEVVDKRSDNFLEVKSGSTINRFYIFGGKDESSQDLIQGITLAGLFADEVVLMPKSFVNQATGRVSVSGGKIWFTCNPGNTRHYIKTEWIDKIDEKDGVYLHFTMADNLSLGKDVVKRLSSMYSGVFHERYISGLWVNAEGAVYDPDSIKVVESLPDNIRINAIAFSTDGGHQQSATATLAVGFGSDGNQYLLDTYYYSPAGQVVKKAPSQLAADINAFVVSLCNQYNANPLVETVDSAEGALRNQYFADYGRRMQPVAKKENNKMIEYVVNYLAADKFRVVSSDNNKVFVDEHLEYRYSDKVKADGSPMVVKENDHTVDAFKYFVLDNAKTLGLKV